MPRRRKAGGSYGCAPEPQRGESCCLASPAGLALVLRMRREAKIAGRVPLQAPPAWSRRLVCASPVGKFLLGELAILGRRTRIAAHWDAADVPGGRPLFCAVWQPASSRLAGRVPGSAPSVASARGRFNMCPGSDSTNNAGERASRPPSFGRGLSARRRNHRGQPVRRNDADRHLKRATGTLTTASGRSLLPYTRISRVRQGPHCRLGCEELLQGKAPTAQPKSSSASVECRLLSLP